MGVVEIFVGKVLAFTLRLNGERSGILNENKFDDHFVW